MMKAMIPSQVGVSLRTLQKIKKASEAHKKIKEAKEAHQKNKKTKKMREKREGAMLLSFYHTCALE